MGQSLQKEPRTPCLMCEGRRISCGCTAGRQRHLPPPRPEPQSYDGPKPSHSWPARSEAGARLQAQPAEKRSCGQIGLSVVEHRLASGVGPIPKRCPEPKGERYSVSPKTGENSIKVEVGIETSFSIGLKPGQRFKSMIRFLEDLVQNHNRQTDSARHPRMWVMRQHISPSCRVANGDKWGIRGPENWNRPPMPSVYSKSLPSP